MSARILIVEDDGPTRQTLRQFLLDEGFDVAVALDGAYATRIAAATQPDVIVLDIGLPVLDGSEFAVRWHARTGAACPPMIVVSGLPHGRAIASEIGAIAFFEKPVELDALGARLHTLAPTSWEAPQR